MKIMRSSQRGEGVGGVVLLDEKLVDVVDDGRHSS